MTISMRPGKLIGFRVMFIDDKTLGAQDPRVAYVGRVAHVRLSKNHHRRNNVQQEGLDRSSENVHEGRRFRDG